MSEGRSTSTTMIYLKNRLPSSCRPRAASAAAGATRSCAYLATHTQMRRGFRARDQRPRAERWISTAHSRAAMCSAKWPSFPGSAAVRRDYFGKRRDGHQDACGRACVQQRILQDFLREFFAQLSTKMRARARSRSTLSTRRLPWW